MRSVAAGAMLLAGLAPRLSGQGVFEPSFEDREPPPPTSAGETGGGEAEELEARVARLKRELADAEQALAELRKPSEIGGEADSMSAAAASGALVIVSSPDAEGTGFIGRLKGKTFFITNIHVLGAARGARFTTLEGRELSLADQAFVSRRRDVALVTVDWDGPVLPVSDSLNRDDVQVGEGVTVMGNSGGARVATRLAGEVRGLGPDEMEVSAKFEPGNSGSPIVHDGLGSVVAVASHLRDFSQKTKWTEDSELGDIRRFGYRLDGEIDWQRIALTDLYRESELYHRFEDRTRALWHISHMLERESTLVTAYRDHSSLGYLYEQIDEGFDWRRGTGSGHNQQLLRQFLQRLSTEIQSDIADTDQGLSVGFYRMRFEEIREARDQAIRSIDNFRTVRL